MLVNKVWFFPALVNGRNLHQIWSEHPECNTTVLKYPKSIVEDHGRMHACYTHVDACKLPYNNMYSLIFHHFKAIRWCSVERSRLMKCFLVFFALSFCDFSASCVWSGKCEEMKLWQETLFLLSHSFSYLYAFSVKFYVELFSNSLMLLIPKLLNRNELFLSFFSVPFWLPSLSLPGFLFTSICSSLLTVWSPHLCRSPLSLIPSIEPYWEGLDASRYRSQCYGPQWVCKPLSLCSCTLYTLLHVGSAPQTLDPSACFWTTTIRQQQYWS